jgi:hypothetical protein
MSDVLAHIEEKLKRANQHVHKVRTECDAFINESANRELVNYDAESAEAFRRFHKDRIVPPRLSVLTGETLYQLRSSLDHLACALILKDGGTLTLKSQFPIERFEPIEKDDLRRYEGQIKGITRPAVLTAIEELQPWKRGNARDAHWLAILKKFSNIDKHRSLLLHVTVVQPQITYSTIWERTGFTGESFSIDYGAEVTPGRHEIFGDAYEIVNVQRRLTPFVAFHQWPGAPYEFPVAYGLDGLVGAVKKTVNDFASFLS